MEAEQTENVEELETAEEIEEEVVDGETTEGEEGEPSETVLEDWQKTDGENDDKPVKFLKAKKKLKGVITEKDAEVERLKAENEALKANKVQPSSLKRPDPLDFDDDNEYNKALDNYNVSLFESTQTKKQQEARNTEFQAEIERNINSHYERAEELIEKSGIAPERFQAADTRVRKMIEEVFPGQGNATTDLLFGSLGEGSEKVGYFLGNNEAAGLKFQKLLREGDGGIKAAIFLGMENNRLNNPQKRRTNARPPAPEISGDANANSSTVALKKKYDKAHKEKSMQQAFNLKRDAKKAGVDVSKW